MCINPSCINESSSFNGLCIYCHKFWDGKEKPAKKVYQIPKESEKRAKENREDAKQNKEILKVRKVCELNLEGCTKKATCIQHLGGRIGKRLTDTKNKLASCYSCNLRAETHPLEALKAGAAISKHKKRII